MTDVWLYTVMSTVGITFVVLFEPPTHPLFFTAITFTTLSDEPI